VIIKDRLMAGHAVGLIYTSMCVVGFPALRAKHIRSWHFVLQCQWCFLVSICYSIETQIGSHALCRQEIFMCRAQVIQYQHSDFALK
jgi:hypothetical protein